MGHLDIANTSQIAGWVTDPDYYGSIQVHVYIDGQIAGRVSAHDPRPDVLEAGMTTCVKGLCGFNFIPPSLSPGTHTVNVYAIGVDNLGNPDNINPQLSGSPKTITVSGGQNGDEYTITSADGKVHVTANARFGGAITKIIDDDNMPGINMINDDHGGAMFQPAFWLVPRHSQLPTNCPDRADMWQNNPTLGGYYQDVIEVTRIGNPIGIFGNNTGVVDPDEFIRLEENGKIIHFKSRFIRHDYCQSGGLPMSKRSEWDTNFYLEQWISFDSVLPRTLKILSKIIFVGTVPTDMGTRQLPVIFARNLYRPAYWKNGLKVVENASRVAKGITPDKNWLALLANDRESGLGIVVSPLLRVYPFPNDINYMFGYDYTGATDTTVIFPSYSGYPELNTMGIVTNVSANPSTGYSSWTFQPEGTFEWYSYYPIGNINLIKSNADSILADITNFGMNPLPGDLNRDGKVDILDLRQLLSSFTNIFDYNVMVGNFGK